MTVNCIAIDDEPLALGLVCSFIEQTPFLRLVGRYANAAAAFEAIEENEVQLIFLDIQMPDLTGMQFARLIGQGRPGDAPRIIFTTAYNHFALEGYKVDALDYLLKPFNYEEFLRAANKGRAWVELLDSTQTTGPSADDSDYLFLKVEYQLMRISFNDILYIEGLKDYVKVHLQGSPAPKPLMSLTSLKNLEDKLPPKRFMRIHRSFIISLEKIESVTKTAVHIGPAVITIGDQYKETFRQFVNKWIV